MAITTFMNLSLPVPTVTLGPAWATELNAALERVDQHDHTSGNGVKITVPALDINTDLSFKSNNATNLKSTRFTDNNAPLSGLQDIRSIYVSGGDLYYNNSSGTGIRITSGGALDASSIGGIGGDYATSNASVYYTNGSDLFTFDQTTNTRAKLDIADVTIREAVASAEGITLRSPTSLAASYNITLPSGLPSSGTKIMTMDSSGNVGVSYDVDDSTLEVSSDTLRVKDAGIVTAKIADDSINKSKLATNIVNSSTDSATVSTTSTSFVSSGISASITPNSTRVLISLEPITKSTIAYNHNSASDGVSQIRILRGSTVLKTITAKGILNSVGAGPAISRYSNFIYPFNILDTGATAGSSNTYTVEYRVTSGGETINLECEMSLLEIL